jgi:uncharacterized protein YfaS (alpha-2-macroglobulin family)
MRNAIFCKIPWLASLLLCCLSPLHALGADETKSAFSRTQTSILRITPEGLDVPQTNQIVIQFSAPVVSLGRMDRKVDEVSISITPRLACHWRWLNSSALACQLDKRELPKGATTYSLTVPRRFDTSSITTLADEVHHSFTTQRPTVTSSWFSTWTGPGTPQIRITTNQRVSADTLRGRLQLVDSGGTAHQVNVSEYIDDDDEDDTRRLAAPGTLWTVTPQEELKLDTSFQLLITPGLISSEGPEPGIENRSLVDFQTFPAPRFLGISCFNLKGEPVWTPGSSQNIPESVTTKGQDSRRCDPLHAVQLVFNTPILKEQLKDIVRSNPDIRGGRTDFDPWQDVYSYSRLTDSHVKDQRYAVNLPYGLKAFASYTLTGEGAKIRDEFGRPLSNDITASFLTDHRRPRYVLDNSFSVLEKEGDSKLPVVVNNVSSLNLAYQILTSNKSQTNLSRTLTPYPTQDTAYHYPIDIRAMLEGRSGVIQGNLTPKPATPDGSRWFFSQVTPYAVHVKLGHFSSVAWVTSLQTGKPIPGAKVTIAVDTLMRLSTTPKELASAITDASGIATLPGTETIDPKLTLVNEWENSKPRLIVRVVKEDDIAIVPVSWDMQVYSDVVYPSTREQYGHIHTWGTTAQGLYKAGDTVQFSLWVRNQDSNTLTPSPQGGYSLKVLDPSDTIVFEVPSLSLSEFGGYSGEFSTKPNAAVGWYRFVLSASFSDLQWEPMRVLISDFTPAPFKVTTDFNADTYRLGDQMSVSTQARLHAGGPYADARARVTARIKGATLPIETPALERFAFDSDLDKDVQIFQKEETLDSKGDHLTTIPLNEEDITFGSIIVESAVRDERGKFVSSFSRKPYLGRDRYAGISQSDWILQTNREAIAQATVVDDLFQVAAHSQATIEWFYEETKAARVKSAGNTYVTKYEQEFVSVNKCSAMSSLEPISCSHTPQRPGRYKVTATVKDTKGRSHSSSLYRWASGAGEVIWSTGREEDLPIIPEKKSYKVGEVARFFIRNPFPGALALLSTERYGILHHWTTSWPDSSVIVEVPITTAHIPGFYLSAIVTSPRVDKPIENQVDLGKPTFRMGYAAIEVVDTAKQLTVDVKTHRSSYKPGDMVQVNLYARSPQGAQQPTEFALTVLDEAVFDLLSQGRDYFDPYKGFYQLDGLDVRNYNLIKMLLGRRNFEKKGASPGGDGGNSSDFRSLRKFVSYWNPAIRADNQGHATVSFQAPDNLTGWKVFAIALTKTDQVGLGEASFAVNKDVEIRSALPNQVREGDTFNASFSVMNRTASPRTLTVEAHVEGDAASPPLKTTIVAEPFKRYPVSLAISSTKRGEARLIAQAYDSTVRDGLTASVPILARRGAVTSANFGSSDGSIVEQEVAVPKDIHPHSGAIGAVVSRSVIGGLEGAFDYMKNYPYECWEQRLSRAVMAMHSISLHDYLPKSFSWYGSERLIQDTVSSLSSFQAPNGGMSFYVPQDEYANQYLSAYTALALNWLREAGYQAPAGAEAKLHAYLASLLKNDSFPEYFSAGMRASIRATALAALSQRGLATMSDLLRVKQMMGTMSLSGKAYYLQAATTLKAPSELQSLMVSQILAHAQESGGTFRLADSSDSDPTLLLGSEMRTQCAVLHALITASEQGTAVIRRQIEPTVPKLVRSITIGGKRKDRWHNTQENTICMGALARYSRTYEVGSNPLELTIAVNSQPLGTVHFTSKASEPQEVSRPLTDNDVGGAQTITISPSGKGRFYYSTRLSYVPDSLRSTPMNAGIEIVREYSVKRNGAWSLLVSPFMIQQGDLVRVDLFVRLSTPRSFVVVDDPIPGGLEAVNRDLATSSAGDSQVDGASAPVGSSWWTAKDWVSFGSSFLGFYHKELRHRSASFYSEQLPAGHYHLSYVAQAIAAGSFSAPSARAEEMYDPDVFGESEATELRINPAP